MISSTMTTSFPLTSPRSSLEEGREGGRGGRGEREEGGREKSEGKGVTFASPSSLERRKGGREGGRDGWIRGETESERRQTEENERGREGGREGRRAYSPLVMQP